MLWLIVAVTSWGANQAEFSVGEGLMSNADFLVSALAGSGTGYVERSLDATTYPPRKTGLERDGFYTVHSIDGRNVSFPGTGLLFYDNTLIIQIGCRKVWHFISTEEAPVTIGKSADRDFQVCAREEDAGDKALAKLYRVMTSGGALSAAGENLVLRDEKGRARAVFRRD